MHVSRRGPIAALLASLVAAGAAGAQPVSFTSNLTTGQEVNPVTLTYAITGLPRPMPFGLATLTLNASQTELTLFATIHNIDFGGQTADLNDDLRAAHIHGGAPPGSNAGVVWGFFGTPFSDLNSTPAANCTAFATGIGGTCQATWNLAEGNNTTLAAQLPNLLGGLAYLNYHTVQNPGGEVRGQLAVVPEPSTVLLLGTGLAAIAVVARRRGRAG